MKLKIRRSKSAMREILICVMLSGILPATASHTIGEGECEEAYLIALEHDTDSDLLTDEEENTLGSDPGIQDENSNGLPDGQDLAETLSSEIAALDTFFAWFQPPYTEFLEGVEDNLPKDRLYTVYIDYSYDCQWITDACGIGVTIGELIVVNPSLHPSWEEGFSIPLDNWHYMQHGSFSYASNLGCDPGREGRVDILMLIQALHTAVEGQTEGMAEEGQEEGAGEGAEEGMPSEGSPEEGQTEGQTEGVSEGSTEEGQTEGEGLAEEGQTEGQTEGEGEIGDPGLIEDGGFEAGTPNPFWETGEGNSPICSHELCGEEPLIGNWSAYFGGADVGSTSAWVQQPFLIPADTEKVFLSFWLSPLPGSGTAYLNILIDNALVMEFVFGSHMPEEYTSLREMNFLPFADGAPHMLRFEGGNTANAGEGEGILLYLDDVAIGFHSLFAGADRNHNYAINLSELLRMIQFFNSDGFHCDASTEDGYAPGDGDRTCPANSSDYNPEDWHINLSELLRIIQFYNSGGYHVCSDGEDGFCPGF